MLAELYVLTGRDAGKLVDAGTGPTIFLGRAASNHLRVRDPQCSRVHCRIDVQTDRLRVQDAGSGNGTLLNGKRLGREAVDLDDGDEIQIGSTRLRILIETPADRAAWPQRGSSEGGPLDPSSVEQATPSALGASASAVSEESAVLSPSAVEKVAAQGTKPSRKLAKPLREVVPGYRLEARLGGHSRQGIAVYRAMQQSLEREVALKVFLRRGPTLAEDVDRFVREARGIARLPHPNIVTIHDVVNRGKMRAIVMEYLAGGSLADRLEDGRALSMQETLRIGISISAALGYLHKHSVVHRGVKPSNVLYAPAHQSYKLSNFGYASGPAIQRSGHTSFFKSPLEGFAYLAPEQLQSDSEPTPRNDVYSLAATLYAALRGEAPFQGDTVPALGAAILRDTPAGLPSATPPTLRAVIETALSKDPARRFPDCHAFSHALRACAAKLNADPKVDLSRPLAVTSRMPSV